MTEKRQYSIIYADPSWGFSSKYKFKKGGKVSKLTHINDHYETMSIDNLCSLPISNLAKGNAILFIWTTDSHLESCLKVIKAWGFTYKTIAFVWLKQTSTGKDCFVKGFWTNKSTEICLLATRGKTYHLLKDKSVRQLIRSVRGKHSEKPNEARERIVQMFGNISRIELFAREKPRGWHVWGNEVESNIDMDDYMAL